MLYPILYTLYLSFMNWTSTATTFVGLSNYSFILTDPNFWSSLINDAFVLLIQVPVMLLLATIIAVALNNDYLRFKWVFRLAVFLPVLVDLVTYSISFQIIFDPHFGLMNYLLGFVHIGPVDWIANSWDARLAIVIMVTWRWTGYNAIILLSGLQTVSKDIYEAAIVDGASRLRIFIQVTIPLLKPILLFCTILSTVGTLQLFTEPYILTGGGPNNATLTPMLYLYNLAFGSFHFGIGSAGTYIITTIIGLLSYLQLRVTNGRDR